MDIRDQIGIYLNTSWKRTREETPYSGHNLIKLAEWTRESGFVKKQEARYKKVTIPCPIIAVVDTKIRENHLKLTITGTKAVYNSTEEFKQLSVSITKKTYKEGTETISTTLEIPRFTRTNATFLVSGLGNKIYKIDNITSNVDSGIGGGKVSFYALASEGSKVLYYLGMYKLHNSIKEVINSIWIAPEKCPNCNGNGCEICNYYGYLGENATKGIALQKGYDVRISRDKFSSYPITDTQWEKIWKFINKAWTQKWWVTPTVKEIKRMFAHFYNVEEGEIIITERYHFSMPQWDISLPLEGAIGSPFGEGDIDLMKFIAESVTPAGVNVFVGFYTIPYFGDIDIECIDVAYISTKPEIYTMRFLESSIEQEYGQWRGRWRCWNGWCECTDNFEGDLSKWNSSGVVDIFNANDIGRHWCRLKDNSYIQTVTGLSISNPTGVVELWIHPLETNIRIGAYLTGVNLWAWYVDFKSGGFYDHNNNLIRSALSDNDFHISIKFISDKTLTGILGFVSGIQINRDLITSKIPFLNPLAPNRPIRIKSSGIGYSFVDNFGADWVSGYEAGDNWPRLYPWGWGNNHVDCLSGVINLYEKYFRKNKFFNINVSGFC